MRAITFMVVSPSGGVRYLAPPHGDGVSADKRRPLGPTNERGHPLQASETALGTVGLVCPMPPHHMTGRQPPTGRIGGGVHLPNRPHIDHGHADESAPSPGLPTCHPWGAAQPLSGSP